MIKVILADDHKIARDGLKAIIDFSKGNIKVVGEAANGKEVIDLLSSIEAHVVIMDISMPHMDGLESTGYIKTHFPSVKVLILSMINDDAYMAKAMRAGAHGYLLKTADYKELTHAIEMIMSGEKYMMSQIALDLLDKVHPSIEGFHSLEGKQAMAAPANGNAANLSKRELEVLNLVAKGYTNAQIADMTFTSKRTVESHRQNLLEKTGCNNTASLIRYAVGQGLLD